MSNPDPNTPPNLRRDGERHAGPLIGMALVVLFGVGLIFYWLAEESASGPDTSTEVNVEAPVSTEGADGEPEAGTVAPAPDAGPGATSDTPADPTPTVDGDNATGPPPATTPGTATTPAPAD